jgi:hypothetical protein
MASQNNNELAVLIDADSPAIVLDKSYLQGAKASRIQELADTNRLVVSDALFYELLTSSEPGRSRCFAKFPVTENPVDLVNHIGTLIRIELDTHSPCGMPSSHCEKLRFQFNPCLVNPDYVLPEEARFTVDEQTTQLQSDVANFLEQIALVPSFFPYLLTGNTAEQKLAHAKAEHAIAEPGALIPFYSKLEPPPGQKPLPPPHLVSENWAIYRWLQVKLLFALDVYVRYGGKVPQTLSSAVYERMEHDVLDAQVLMLACLEGAFATREKKLKHWWSLLCPDGALYE